MSRVVSVTGRIRSGALHTFFQVSFGLLHASSLHYGWCALLVVASSNILVINQLPALSLEVLVS